MNEEKRNRIAAAVTINAILLVFILAVIVIVQVVVMGVLSNRKTQLENEYAQLLEEQKKLDDFSERFFIDEKLQNIAVEYYKLTGKQLWDTEEKQETPES